MIIDDCPNVLCRTPIYTGNCNPYCIEMWKKENDLTEKGKAMVKLTQSLQQWLWVNHRELLPLIMFGHVELFTAEMRREYLEWCQTEEGMQYLKGGSKYKE